jgi:hypothetical protein
MNNILSLSKQKKIAQQLPGQQHAKNEVAGGKGKTQMQQ